MKKAIFFLSIPLFILSCQSAGESKKSDQVTKQEIQVAPENIQFVEISVEGMTCSGCESTVEKSILSMEGVMEAEASHHTKTATVKYDKSRTNADDMMAKINEKGYEALEYKIKEETE